MNMKHENGMGALAAHLEQVADQLSEVNTTPESGRYIGMEACVEELISHLMIAMFPYHFGKVRARFVEEEKRTWELMRTYDALTQALEYVLPEGTDTEAAALEVIDELPEIVDMLKSDVQAAYEGDPAALSTDEIIMTYPAFKAIAIYRVAHKLYQMRVPILPRMMTEYAHARTGIDIHPGATIGRYFFIDHGTGVVIGETTTIGEHVKLYQHVTLGAKSFEVGEDGTLVKGIKRHPDIGNNVVIYAGATILGGTTRIGDDCVVGGNVWMTHSMEPGRAVVTTVSEANQKFI